MALLILSRSGKKIAMVSWYGSKHPWGLFWRASIKGVAFFAISSSHLISTSRPSVHHSHSFYYTSHSFVQLVTTFAYLHHLLPEPIYQPTLLP